ncbi:MAG: hypothetical protein A2Y80_03775 [Deltaproteobacteria bacterium RBG_13_58_19]|nr:MAG: hypothetical protein A2Y80_03775 [Deltaproteobacteria bacterium RBG_13_58_19]
MSANKQKVRPIITLLTDFGTRDAYVASLKGVILGLNPKVRLVDLSHAVPPQGNSWPWKAATVIWRSPAIKITPPGVWGPGWAWRWKSAGPDADFLPLRHKFPSISFM